MNLVCLAVLLCLFGFACGQKFDPSTHPGDIPTENPTPRETLLILQYISDHPEKCWIEKHEAAVAPGDTFKIIGDCNAYECHEDFSYSVYNCGYIGARPPCYQTPVDNTKLYPDCCPQHKCDKE